MNGAGRGGAWGAAAGILASLVALSCGGGGGGGESAPVAERIALPAGARIYVHGEAIDADTAVVAWSAAEDATLNGRPLGRRPDDLSRAGDDELRARFGRVPMVRAMVNEGTSLAEAAGAFVAREEGIRRRVGAAYEAARGASNEGEAARAALGALTGDDRALLDGEPEAGEGIVEIRFTGRPPETWILRSLGRAGLPRPGCVGREGAVAIAAELRGCFAAPDGAALALLGDENLFITGAGRVSRAAAQIDAAREGRVTDGPLPPKVLAEFLPLSSRD